MKQNFILYIRVERKYIHAFFKKNKNKHISGSVCIAQQTLDEISFSMFLQDCEAKRNTNKSKSTKIPFPKAGQHKNTCLAPQKLEQASFSLQLIVN